MCTRLECQRIAHKKYFPYFDYLFIFKSIVQYVVVVGGKKFIEVNRKKIELSLVELTTLKLRMNLAIIFKLD